MKNPTQTMIPTWDELQIICGEKHDLNELILSVEASTLFGNLFSVSSIWPEKFLVNIGGGDYEVIRGEADMIGKGEDSELGSVMYSCNDGVEYPFTIRVWND